MITWNAKFLSFEKCEQLGRGTHLTIHPPGDFLYEILEKYFINSEIIFRGVVKREDHSYLYVYKGDVLFWGPCAMARSLAEYFNGPHIRRK